MYKLCIFIFAAFVSITAYAQQISVSYTYVWHYDTIYDMQSGVKDFAYTGAMASYTTPITTTYSFEVWGAQGGTVGTIIGSKGAYAISKVLLAAGENLKVLVGGQGGLGGGGGGTFITSSSNTPYAVAGGGGGASGPTSVPGTYSNILAHHGQATQNGGSTYSSGGGTAGNGGNTGITNGESSGGGGLLTDGTSSSNSNGGRAFVNGGAGGSGSGVAYNGIAPGTGGFGGGAGAYNNNSSGYVRGGGGGGYSGGQGGTYSASTGYWGGGGGGSYYTGASSYAVDGNSLMPSTTGSTEVGHSGNGYARITYDYKAIDHIDSSISHTYITTTITDFVCKNGVYNNYGFTVNGTDLTNGEHTFTNHFSYGSTDSTVVLNITIRPDVTAYEEVEAPYSFTWPANGETYTESGIYTVSMVSENGCDSSIVLALTIYEPSGVNGVLPNTSGISIAPNPSKDYIDITNDTRSEIVIQLYNSRGQKMLTSESSSEVTRISLNDYPDGFYFISFSVGGRVVKTEKFVKMR